jgi:hypothetical protein
MYEVSTQSRSEETSSARPSVRTVCNWILAALTVPGAMAVVAAAYISVLGTAGCAEHTCHRLGPGPFVFGLITYGAPVVAALAIAVSFMTATRRYGTVVPVIAWLLLGAGLIVLDVSFQTP